MQRVINVSNRLPVTVGDDGGVRKSGGGLVNALSGAFDDPSTVSWIGWAGGDIPDGRRPAVEDLLTREFGCLPVFFSAEEAAGFYDGFANASLWPLLHNMPSRFRYEPQWWDHYQQANRRYAEKVLSVAADGDLVWVHDYHLMLLPEMLRRANPSLKVGFFLHTPFPSYETFRCHPRRAELIAGVLGAHTIGFHTFGYLGDFSAAAQRLLGAEAEITHVCHGGRRTALGVYPIGINAARFDAATKSAEYARHVESFRKANAGRHVILSVERMDYTTGILERLNAIEMFLARRANRDDVIFIFASVPSREAVEEYPALLTEVERRIGRLNGRYATLHNSPVRFIDRSVEFPELCALYAVADVALVTPLIDGMNLVAKEFAACQGEDPGVLILSEFAGAASELFNATVVNPYDAQAVACAIDAALATPAAERRRRMEPMRDRIMTADARQWAGRFLDDLAAAATAAAPPTVPDAAGRLQQARSRLARALGEQRRVAMVLGYDGTLREIVRDPAAAAPTPETAAVLRAMRNCPGLEVTVISGRTAADLDAFVGAYGFGLIAEHGAAVRRPARREWEQLDCNLTCAWMDDVLEVLRLYERATPGSAVERKRASVVWHYRNAEALFGARKAAELVAELAPLTAGEPLTVRHGKKIVEVTAAHVNKGAAVLRALGPARYDLIVCAGDDATDEDMFRLGMPELLSIHAGTGETRAQVSLPTPAALRDFLLDALKSPPSSAAPPVVPPPGAFSRENLDLPQAGRSSEWTAREPLHPRPPASTVSPLDGGFTKRPGRGPSEAQR